MTNPPSPFPVFGKYNELKSYQTGRSSIVGVKDPIKLSSNENPFGASIEVLSKLEKKSLKKIHRYPDKNCFDLRVQIAEKYDINYDRIVCGAGSDELISLICRGYATEGDEILCSKFGFSMYPIYGMSVGADVVRAEETNYETNIDNILSSVTNKTKIVFVANPNNPTGSLIKHEDMLRLKEGLSENIILVIDTAYLQYVDNQNYSGCLELVENSENVVVINTFSKVYGLGGLRLGWGYFPKEIAELINKLRSPFSITNITQDAGLYALKDDDFVKKSVDHNTKWRELLFDKFTSLQIKTYNSQGNFLMVEFPSEQDKKKIDEFLLKNGVIVRDLSSYKIPAALRITIGTEKENQKLIQLFEEIIK